MATVREILRKGLYGPDKKPNGHMQPTRAHKYIRREWDDENKRYTYTYTDTSRGYPHDHTFHLEHAHHEAAGKALADASNDPVAALLKLAPDPRKMDEEQIKHMHALSEEYGKRNPHSGGATNLDDLRQRAIKRADAGGAGQLSDLTNRQLVNMFESERSRFNELFPGGTDELPKELQRELRQRFSADFRVIRQADADSYKATKPILLSAIEGIRNVTAKAKEMLPEYSGKADEAKARRAALDANLPNMTRQQVRESIVLGLQDRLNSGRAMRWATPMGDARITSADQVKISPTGAVKIWNGHAFSTVDDGQLDGIARWLDMPSPLDHDIAVHKHVNAGGSASDETLADYEHLKDMSNVNRAAPAADVAPETPAAAAPAAESPAAPAAESAQVAESTPEAARAAAPAPEAAESAHSTDETPQGHTARIAAALDAGVKLGVHFKPHYSAMPVRAVKFEDGKIKIAKEPGGTFYNLPDRELKRWQDSGLLSTDPPKQTADGKVIAPGSVLDQLTPAAPAPEPAHNDIRRAKGVSKDELHQALSELLSAVNHDVDSIRSNPEISFGLGAELKANQRRVMQASNVMYRNGRMDEQKEAMGVLKEISDWNDEKLGRLKGSTAKQYLHYDPARAKALHQEYSAEADRLHDRVHDAHPDDLDAQRQLKNAVGYDFNVGARANSTLPHIENRLAFIRQLHEKLDQHLAQPKDAGVQIASGAHTFAGLPTDATWRQIDNHISNEAGNAAKAGDTATEKHWDDLGHTYMSLHSAMHNAKSNDGRAVLDEKTRRKIQDMTGKEAMDLLTGMHEGALSGHRGFHGHASHNDAVAHLAGQHGGTFSGGTGRVDIGGDKKAPSFGDMIGAKVDKLNTKRKTITHAPEPKAKPAPAPEAPAENTQNWAWKREKPGSTYDEREAARDAAKNTTPAAAAGHTDSELSPDDHAFGQRVRTLESRSQEITSTIRKLRDRQEALRPSFGQTFKPSVRKERAREHEEIERQIRPLESEQSDIHQESTLAWGGAGRETMDRVTAHEIRARARAGKPMPGDDVALRVIERRQADKAAGAAGAAPAAPAQPATVASVGSRARAAFGDLGAATPAKKRKEAPRDVVQETFGFSRAGSVADVLSKARKI